ncbi:unnamed protein product [Clavelina lepadiformis]|uniref:DnaJ homolog subfamily C member 2 n=1 Tax=Clavelina lepadiformis TaxID=159417 RepID=A0ABP0FIA6_CLALP
MRHVILLLFLSYFVQYSVAQWFSPEQTEIFDLVDQTKLNFYEFLGLSQDASQPEVRRAYRKLSLTMHPDKNKTEGAEESFRILAAMYEILKTKEKREIYDEVLANGLPAAYLYVPRQLRKMSLLEVSVIIALIVTLGHFLVIWGSYAEKKLALDEYLPRLRKKQKKQRKKGLNNADQIVEEIENLVTKPTLYDVLPILIFRKFYGFAVWLPEFVKFRRELKRLKKEEEELKRKKEAEADREYQEQLARRSEAKKLKQERSRQRKEELLEAQKKSSESGPTAPSVFENLQSIEELEAMYDEWADEDFKKKNTKKRSDWTEEDQSQLVRLMSKYPGGTSERWQKIAKELGRSVGEVTNQAKASRTGISIPGSKVKHSAVSETFSNALTKNRNADANKIPDDVITTQAYDNSDMQMRVSAACEQRSESSSNRVDPPSPSSKVKRRQESRDIKRDIHSNQDDVDDTQNDVTSSFMVDAWEQSQQKLLEMALTQFPKSSAERWDKIAKCVPGKSKEECIARYRFLVEKIQQRKKNKS